MSSTHTISVVVSPGLFDRIEKARAHQPRSAWIVDLLYRYFDGKDPAPIPVPPGFFGPVEPPDSARKEVAKILRGLSVTDRVSDTTFAHRLADEVEEGSADWYVDQVLRRGINAMRPL